MSRLSASERRRLAEHWTRAARMEHASIAAFARFTLHLLALGAPSDLIVASNRGETRAAVEAREMIDATRDAAVRHVLETIARDETRHAELAWRTLAWLLASGRMRASDVRAELDRALAEMTPGDADVASGIVRPCAEALLALDTAFSPLRPSASKA